jgi:hypothetical protein
MLGLWQEPSHLLSIELDPQAGWYEPSRKAMLSCHPDTLTVWSVPQYSSDLFNHHHGTNDEARLLPLSHQESALPITGLK